MASLNHVALIGNVGRDAEMMYLESGTAKTSFSIAVNYRTKKNDEWVDGTEWVNLVLFGDKAERISQYITKGKSLYVSGRLQMRSWEDDNGTKHHRTEVIANDIQFLDRRGKDADDDTWE